MLGAAKTGLLTLASWGSITCAAPHIPDVQIVTQSREIAYDYSRSEQELSTTQMNYKSPYPPSADVVTRGLREDHPEITLGANWIDTSYPWQKMDCLAWDKVTVKIELQPRIYIASEVAPGVCRDTILGHELHHVQIDREVLAEYSPHITAVMQNIVRATSPVGPLPHEQVAGAGKDMMQQLENTLHPIEQAMFDDLSQRQQAFDSRAEYDRVGAICRGAADNPDDGGHGEVKLPQALP